MIVVNDKIKKAMKLIKKYGLIADPSYEDKGYDENRYGWIMNRNYIEGNIMGIGDTIPYKDQVMFAEGVDFGRYEKGVIACYGWEMIPMCDYEERIKDLKEQFDEAMIKYKKYLIDEKMERLVKDFE